MHFIHRFYYNQHRMSMVNKLIISSKPRDKTIISVAAVKNGFPVSPAQAYATLALRPKIWDLL